MGSFPQETDLHKLLQRGLFHGLLFFTNSSSVGPFHSHSSGTNTPAWVEFHRVRSPASKPAPMWAPLFMDPLIFPEVSSSMGFPCGHSLLQISTCSSAGSSMDCRWISALPWTSVVCRGTAVLPWSAPWESQKWNLCSGAWSTSSPLSSLTLVCLELPLLGPSKII